MDLEKTTIGQYRSHDPPKNFALKVKLWKLTSGSSVPGIRHRSVPSMGGATATPEIGREALELAERNQDGQEMEEIVIHWQEKLFCEREVDFYANPVNCVSALDQKYHEQVTRLSANNESSENNGRQNKRIFTYLDADGHDIDEATNFMTTSSEEKPTILTQKMMQLKFGNVGRRPLAGSQMGRAKLVSDNPSKLVRANHVITTPSKVMFIMADLSPDRMGTIEDEYVLCVVKIDTNGQIIIKPDLNNKQPYRVETYHEIKEIYEYTLGHCSKQLKKLEREQESKLISELYNRHEEVMASRIGSDLQPMPRPGDLIYYVFGEIVCAKNCEYDEIFVEYFLDLPPYWKSTTSILTGTTQKCSTNDNGIANFCFPFEYQLHYTSPEDKEEPFVKWPTMFLEISSSDSWQRYRKEGYGYFSLPNSAGCHTIEVQTWRPCGDGFVHEMQRFFIGGAPELKDPIYVKAPTGTEEDRLSKFYFRTVTTGSVTIRLYTLLQYRNAKGINHGREKRTGGVMAMDSLAHVLDTFHKAKRRMLDARATLPLVR